MEVYVAKIKRPSRVVLIRHGESKRNVKKAGSVYFADDEARQDIKGVPDYKIPLTDQGSQQARLTGRELRELFGAPDYLYHSGYKRTRDTAVCLLSAYPQDERERVQVRMNPFIRERDSGYAYDMTEDEAETNFPWLQEHWKTSGGFFARPPGGESLSDVSSRVYSFINMLFRDRAGQSVFVVTHGGTIRCFRFWLERWSYEQALEWPEGQSPKNCGVTDYEFDPKSDRLVLRNYNASYW